ncbi:hypothetical protein HYT55_05295 [Candidatus Woesearchaeota archaeon]|nr:hypothetical protein [Candidatus Woesearchaeota archaeon]
MTLNLLVVEELDKVEYQRLVLDDKFTGVHYFDNLTAAEEYVGLGQRIDVAIVNPLVEDRSRDNHSRARELMTSLKTRGTKVILPLWGLKAEAMGLEVGREYDEIHSIPYKAELLVEQIQRLGSQQ